ncbi:hypothetical protein [uncultured Mediterranean phage]|nr:hypothetical protein [uncultured Mediterranean phage]
MISGIADTKGNPPYWMSGEDGVEYVKVINFPVVENAQNVGGESMWVRVIAGGENAGIGTLDNDPAFCEELACGDLVHYCGGDDDTKAQFKAAVPDEKLADLIDQFS